MGLLSQLNGKFRPVFVYDIIHKKAKPFVLSRGEIIPIKKSKEILLVLFHTGR